MPSYRQETDLLGTRDVPAEVLWGIHTLRAVENFPVAGRPVHRELVHAYRPVEEVDFRSRSVPLLGTSSAFSPFPAFHPALLLAKQWHTTSSTGCYGCVKLAVSRANHELERWAGRWATIRCSPRP